MSMNHAYESGRDRRWIPAFAGMTALLLTFACGAFAAGPELLSGDAAYAVRTATSGAVEALALYEKAATGPDAVEARWKAARALHWLGDRSADKKTKNAYFEKGIALAQAAVAAAPDRPEARFWLAALYGSYGESRGVLKSLKLVGPMREQLDAVNRIDERYQGGGAVRVLGVIDYKVPGFAGGSKKRAIERLDRAVAIDPSNAYNQYYLAEGLSEVGRKKEALAHLDTLAGLGPNADVDGPDLASIRAKGEALKKKIGG